MAYTIHVTKDADSNTAILTDMSVEDLADLIFGVIALLPTEDPAVEGALWLDAGVVTVSAGA